MQSFRHDQTVESINKKKMPAIEVFSKALRYLADTLLKFIHDTEVIEIEAEIRWVLTVPAIWRPGARHFMRKAAYEVTVVHICGEVYTCKNMYLD